MSRFVNLLNTRTIHDACRCDGKPHPTDDVEILNELPYGAEGLIGTAGWAAGDEKVYNYHAARLKLVELGVMSWNLRGPNGTEMPVSATSVALLDKPTVEWIARELNASAKLAGSLPNPSAGRSRNGSSGTTSRTRGTPAASSSTTSS